MRDSMRCLSTPPRSTESMVPGPKERGVGCTDDVFRQFLTTGTALVAFLLVHACEMVFAGDPETARFRYSLTKTELHRTPRFLLEIADVPDCAKAKRW